MSIFQANGKSYDSRGRWRTEVYAHASEVGGVNKTLYVSGDAFTEGSWRTIVLPAEGGFPLRDSNQRFEEMTESDITLDDAKVIEIEALPAITEDNKYYATVLSDTRNDLGFPLDLGGDQSGRAIQWDGSLWVTAIDEWFQKGFYLEGSFFSDRLIAQRMNLARTDPVNPLAYPQGPSFGVTYGTRNTQFDGLGVQMVSFTDKNDLFGMVPQLFHATEQLDQFFSLLADGTQVGSGYKLTFVSGTIYNKGAVIIDQGITFVCNTRGLQTGSFQDNIASWDQDFPAASILIGSEGQVLTNEDGNILITG